MNVEAQIQEYAEKLKSPDISARVKKRILQKLGKLKKQKAEGNISSPVENDSDNEDAKEITSEKVAAMEKELSGPPPSKKSKIDMGNVAKPMVASHTQKAQNGEKAENSTSNTNTNVSKKERKNLLHLLNKDLANFAVKKQADKAKLAVKQFTKKGVQLDTLTYTNLINVYVRCNEIGRVSSVLKEMKDECIPLNIVTYTTVLKGFTENGMIKEASELFDEMISKNQFNARSITTYLRGCIRTGTVSRAVSAYKHLRDMQQSGHGNASNQKTAGEDRELDDVIRMDDDVDEQNHEDNNIDVTQESSCLEYVVKLLCQAGRATDAATLIKSHIDFLAKSGHSVSEGSAIANAGLYYILARTSVLFGQWSDADKYTKLALELLEIEDKANLTQSMKRKFAETFYQEDADGLEDLQYNPSVDAMNNKSIRLFRQHRRAELRSSLELLEDYLSAIPEPDRLSSHTISSLIQEVIPTNQKTAVIAIASYHTILSKLFNFGFDGMGDMGKVINANDVDSLLTNLLQGHKTKFGMVSPQVKAIINQLLHHVQDRLHEDDDDGDDDDSDDEPETDADAQVGFPQTPITNRTIKHFLKRLEDSFLSNVMRVFASSSGQVNLRRLFYEDDDIEEMIQAGIRDEIPVKLEIGSGNGDWIVAQAEADRVVERVSQSQYLSHLAKQQMYRHKKQEGNNPHAAVSGSTAATNATSLRIQGHWIALELRCDRVYNILANHLLTMRPLSYLAQHHADLKDLHYANNLAIMGGDAVQIVNQRIPKNSISEIFINYPQPPERVTGSGKGSNKNQGKHLLTKEFFYQLLQILKEQGTITLLTDNLPYAQNLAQSLVELAENSGTKKSLLFDAVDSLVGEADNDGLWKIQETFPIKLKKDGTEIDQEITVWRGEPGKQAGHVTTVSSYFDRMWAMGQKKRRWFLYLRKQVVTSRVLQAKAVATGDKATAAAASMSTGPVKSPKLGAEEEDEFMVDDNDDEDD